MDINDNLLDAWIRLSVILKNERYVDTLTFNETLILRLLSKKKQEQKQLLAIQEICEKTKMLKSAVNRTLNDLEKKSFITRKRFLENRKIVFISLTDAGQNHYLEENAKIKKIVNEVKEQLGIEKTNELINTFNNVSSILEEMWKGGKINGS